MDFYHLYDKKYVKEQEKYARERYSPLKWTPPDEALFGGRIFDIPKEKAERLRFKAVKYAFNHHHSKNPFYHRFCKELDVKPDDIRNESDFLEIPLISDIFFKNYPEGIDFINWLDKIYTGKMPSLDIKNPSFDGVIDALQEKEITLVFSTGTSGRFSFIPRDELTWKRQMYAYSRIFELLPFIPSPSNSRAIWAGPNPRKTHLFIGRVAMLALDLFNESRIQIGIDRELTTDLVGIFMGINRGIKERLKALAIRPFMMIAENRAMDTLIENLEECEKKKEKVVIGGPPFLIDAMLSRIEKKGKEFDFTNGMVITGGGWIGVEQKNFRNKIKGVFGIPANNCRDVYSMVECSVPTMECEGHYKHIPHSVLYPMVLDEESEIMGYGEWGRFAFLDPLANSYPGFIMTNDRVKMLEFCPKCGRPGPVIEDISRMKSVEGRGCGAIIARMLEYGKWNIKS